LFWEAIGLLIVFLAIAALSWFTSRKAFLGLFAGFVLIVWLIYVDNFGIDPWTTIAMIFTIAAIASRAWG